MDEKTQNTHNQYVTDLFASEDDARLLQAKDHLARVGCQYHWHNHAYRDFQDYLEHLRSKRRKQVHEHE